jgi:gamma-glutamyl hercynylcysteine S-oxide synthase
MGAIGELAGTDIRDALAETRRQTLWLVDRLDDDELRRVHSTLMSPLAWDLGHIAAFEDLWLVHRHGGRPLLHADLADVYDAFETPRAGRGDLAFLAPARAREYLEAVRTRSLAVLGEIGAGDGTIPELILRHEQQHSETMLQTMQLAGLQGFIPDPLDAGRGPAAVRLTGLETVRVPAGPCTIGAPAEGFAYDNERPRHRVELAAFELGRVPVSNGAFRAWIEDGGYRRPEWWSAEGWAWRRATGATRPGGWSEDLHTEWRLGIAEPLRADRPVVHICVHEAEAFARAHEARLPTELEWEKAATWDPEAGRATRYPWGDEPPVAGHHANLDQRSGGPVPVGSLPAGVAPSGCEQLIGDVWEWTSSDFGGYPGFAAHPYPEYSEVFFGAGHRVLRGGSWATRARVATGTFRNWDLPERRQIFAGVRIARDAAG